jgi:hypothetical protein
MADYWIKWYHEILDDPKMAILPDRLWRRFSELCLLSGRLFPEKTGFLPATKQIAWALRMSVDDLQVDMDQLSSDGFIESYQDGWVIVNFQKRQQSATSTERTKQYRERKQKEQYYNGDVTNSKRNVTQSRAEQSRAEQNDNSQPNFIAVDAEALSLFSKITGFTAFPVKEMEQRIEQLRSFSGRDSPADYLKPYYAEWCRRGYSKANLGWLDWAVVGEIPPVRKKEPPPNHKPTKAEELAAAAAELYGTG